MKLLKKGNQKKIAAEILEALDQTKQIAKISKTFPSLTLKEAYGIAQEVERLRVNRNENVIGLKIGFTNRNIWKQYNAKAPIVGAIYDTTLKGLDESFSIEGLLEPKIEPEVILKIGKTPNSKMNSEELLDCVSHISHGFEVVHSIFKNWEFTTIDTIVAFGLHGALLCGPFYEVTAVNKGKWFKELTNFKISLSCNGNLVDEGKGSNVLDFGPLEALKYILGGEREVGRDGHIKPGDLVTTGTLTEAFSIKKGETWETSLSGIELEGIRAIFK